MYIVVSKGNSSNIVHYFGDDLALKKHIQNTPTVTDRRIFKGDEVEVAIEVAIKVKGSSSHGSQWDR